MHYERWRIHGDANWLPAVRPSECSVEPCGRKVKAQGWCRVHYQRWRDHGDPEKVRARKMGPGTKCSVEACTGEVVARGWCSTHYSRWTATGDVRADEPIQKKNPTRCTVRACTKKPAARGLCIGHYQRWRICGDVRADEPLIGARTCDLCQEKFKGRSERCKPCRESTHECPGCGGNMSRKAKSCQACSAPSQSGALHPAWKGGVNKDSSGYLREYRPGHPRASRGGYVKQHILVMESMIGRLTLPHENVHHKNGSRTDNRPEHLELWSTSQPSGQRVRDKVNWAFEILQTYRPGALSGCSVATAVAAPSPAVVLTVAGDRTRLDTNGYVRVYAAGHPNAPKSGWVAQHRLVMESTIGRLLLRSETVHHKNGDRTDNRPSNLELWATGQPAGQRTEDKADWAEELLALYAPDVLLPVALRRALARRSESADASARVTDPVVPGAAQD